MRRPKAVKCSSLGRRPMQGAAGLAVLSECKRKTDVEAAGGRRMHVEWRESGQVINLRAGVDDNFCAPPRAGDQ